MFVENPSGEKLSVLVEGKKDAPVTIVLAHGFCSDKYGSYFDYFVKTFSDMYRIVCFDLSGCGESEGRHEDGNYEKWAQDLQSILAWTKKTFGGETYIVGHSMGSYVTALLSLEDVGKTVFTGLPHADVLELIDHLQKKILLRTGIQVDEIGVTPYLNSRGRSVKLGSSFWKVLREFQPVVAMQSYA